MPNYMQPNRELSSTVKKKKKTYHNICQHLLKSGCLYVTKGTCIAKIQHIKLRMFLRKDNKVANLHHYEWIEFPLFILTKNLCQDLNPNKKVLDIHHGIGSVVRL